MSAYIQIQGGHPYSAVLLQEKITCGKTEMLTGVEVLAMNLPPKVIFHEYADKYVETLETCQWYDRFPKYRTYPDPKKPDEMCYEQVGYEWLKQDAVDIVASIFKLQRLFHDPEWAGDETMRKLIVQLEGLLEKEPENVPVFFEDPDKPSSPMPPTMPPTLPPLVMEEHETVEAFIKRAMKEGYPPKEVAEVSETPEEYLADIAAM